MIKKLKENKGFTLIELLTVISIIGLISTMIIVAFSHVRAKARDTKRLHDTKQIRTMVELYLSDHSVYPGGDVDDFTKKMVVIGFSGSPFKEGSNSTALELDYNFSIPDIGDGDNRF